MMDLLLELGADIHTLGGNQLQESSIFIAAANNDVGTIAFLAARGGDVGQKNKNGCTPAHAAAAHHDLKALEALNAIGAALDVVAKDGETVSGRSAPPLLHPTDAPNHHRWCASTDAHPPH